MKPGCTTVTHYDVDCDKAENADRNLVLVLDSKKSVGVNDIGYSIHKLQLGTDQSICHTFCLSHKACYHCEKDVPDIGRIRLCA